MLRPSTASLTRNPKEVPLRADGQSCAQPNSEALESGTSSRISQMTMTWRWSARGLLVFARPGAGSFCLAMAPRSSLIRTMRSYLIRRKTMIWLTRCTRPIPSGMTARPPLDLKGNMIPLKYPNPQPLRTTSRPPKFGSYEDPWADLSLFLLNLLSLFGIPFFNLPARFCLS